MKRRGGVVRIRKCRIAGLLLVSFWSLLCIILLVSMWKQRQQFERELMSQPNQGETIDPIRMKSPSGNDRVHATFDENARDEVVTRHAVPPTSVPPNSSLVLAEESILHHDDPIVMLRQDQRQLAESMSSVDYFSCCGLGHRLSKMSDAYYVAKKQLNFQLRVFWASCEVLSLVSQEYDDTTEKSPSNEKGDAATSKQKKNITTVEVFQYFFGPQPFSEIKALHEKQQQNWNGTLHNYTTHHNLRLNNEIPGFKKFKRQSNEFFYVPIQRQQVDTENKRSIIPPNRTTSQEVCPCHGLEDFFQETAAFHQSLKERFVTRHSTLVEYWRDRFQFSNHTVFGLHVRAGNGESGDFLRKKRGIEDWDTWSSSMAELIAKMIRQVEWISMAQAGSDHSEDTKPKPPLLFLATDTDSVLHKLQHHLQGIVPVVSLPQEREAEGDGVAFGNKILVHGKCLEKWQNSILDMMLLSDANVIIAGRPSSFTQSLPMSIALSRNHIKDIIKSPPYHYCEVNRNATLYQCYSDFEDWCCNGKSSFHMEGIHPGYEYRRLPLALEQQDFSEKIQPRKAINFQNVQLDPSLARRRIPLPYDWAQTTRD